VKREITTNSAEETMQQGRELAKSLTPPVIVALWGELGSGKTTLTKGIVAGLGVAREDEVTSPTFTLVHVFKNHVKVFHADLYRIENFQDLATLGLEDIFQEPAVVIIEWPEFFKLRANWPAVHVHLEHLAQDRRLIRISGNQSPPLTSSIPAP
jgi:tRNA threonylcarbamoyladenosine biosynthesis protein TsaE